MRTTSVARAHPAGQGWLALLALTSCTADLELREADGHVEEARDAAPNDAPGDGPHDGGPAGPIPEGTVTLRADACALTDCETWEIACGGRTLAVDLQVLGDTAAPRGTIVVGTGGGGQSFAGETLAAELLDALLAAGYRVIDRRWHEPGWFAGARGVAASSCAYALLLGELRSRYEGPLCAAGFSGGAIEIAYSLARWNGADLLDAAVLGAGPSMTDLTRTCPGVSPVAWGTTECPELAARYLPGYETRCVSEGGLRCVHNAGGVRSIDSAWGEAAICSAGLGAERLIADGVVAPGARFVYPDTRVHFVLGANECSAAVLLYVERVGVGAGSAHALTLVPDTAHGITDTPEGRRALLDALTAGCAP